jgi:hypothetical protein
MFFDETNFSAAKIEEIGRQAGAVSNQSGGPSSRLHESMSMPMTSLYSFWMDQ